MHRPWAAAAALLLPGLRLCIWFFISNRLMCSDTAPLWEVADRHCQYFLLKKNPNKCSPLKCCFSESNYGVCSLHLERRFPIQPLHFLHPWSPFFCCRFLLLFRKKKRNVNIPCHFWQLLGWLIPMSTPGCCAVNWNCSNIQESGTQNLEVGMKVRKIKHRHWRTASFYFVYVVLLLYSFTLTF